MSDYGRKRLVADRFRRIWVIAQHIADHPGQSRGMLATTFHLSERQLQADLNIMRSDMHLPLVRRAGYRFVGEGGPTGGFTLGEAQLLVLLIRQAERARTVPAARLADLTRKLPGLFPAHLQPLIARTLDAAATGGAPGRVFAALADALIAGTEVTLHYPRDSRSVPIALPASPTVRPELLIPYLQSWYVIGACRARGRTVMVKLDDVTAVTAVAS